jgi:hypothetical protein
MIFCMTKIVNSLIYKEILILHLHLHTKKIRKKLYKLISINKTKSCQLKKLHQRN